MEEVRRLSYLNSQPGTSGLDLLNSVNWGATPEAQSLSYTIAERGLLILLEKSHIGKQKLSFDEVQAIKRVMCDYLRHGRFYGRLGGVWLGGRADCLTGIGAGDREKWASSLVIGCSLLRVSDMIFTAIQLIEQEGGYRNSAEFVYFLSSQDDRLLTVLLAMLLEKDCYVHHDAFRPTISCLHAFAGIDFEYEVLLDWLNSDLVSLPFLSRCVEDMTERFALYKTEADLVQKMRESAEEMSFMPGTWIEEPEDEAAEGALVLELEEIEGERPAKKKMRLSRTEPKRTWVPSQPQIYDEPLLQKVYDMFVRLRLRLESIGSKGLGSYTALIKLLEKFEKVYEGAAEQEEPAGNSGRPPSFEYEDDKENNPQ